jgi:hypothetical protein
MYHFMQAMRNGGRRSSVDRMAAVQTAPLYKIPSIYFVIFGICTLFVLLALILDNPAQLLLNYYTIVTSRCALVTDYIALAGIGAALLNSAVLGYFYLTTLVIMKREADGKLVAALFVALGFSLFGKNIFNTIPIFVGVWLYSKFYRVKFSDLIAIAIFSATVSPLVSEIAFFGDWTSPVKILAAYGIGLFIGFIFPVVTEASKRMHRGYCLYNAGAAGGFIATFFAGILRSAGFDILPMHFWDTTHTFVLAYVAYFIALVLILYGIVSEKPLNAISKFKELLKENDVNNNDFLTKYGSTCFISIGIMCVLSTSTMLILRIPINGPVLGGILTVSGFGANGKHIKNTIPVLLGSIIATQFKLFELTSPSFALAILFSTGLAPISGKHGWPWGILIGFLHVSVASFVGTICGGLNLYNNGFAGSFVAITFVPIIVFFKELHSKQRSDITVK